MGRHFTDREYLDILESTGPDTATGLARRTGRHREKVRQRLHGMRDAGLVAAVPIVGRGNPLLFWSANDPYGGPDEDNLRNAPRVEV